MAYTAMATRETPALIIYLLDTSISMDLEVEEGVRRVDIVSDALLQAFREIVRLSRKSQTVSPRYLVAVYAYNETVQDVLGGVKTSVDLQAEGVPFIREVHGYTDTYAAFARAEALLVEMLPRLRNAPAPLVCHLTDGEYMTEDPTPVIERIRALDFTDGPPLIENIYCQSNALRTPVGDIRTWPGVLEADEIIDSYARWLYDLSSPIPPSYLERFTSLGYSLRPGTRLFFPGDHLEMVRAAFVMSTMTRTTTDSAG